MEISLVQQWQFDRLQSSKGEWSASRLQIYPFFLPRVSSAICPSLIHAGHEGKPMLFPWLRVRRSNRRQIRLTSLENSRCR